MEEYRFYTNLSEIVNLFVDGYEIHMIIGRRRNELHRRQLPTLPPRSIWVCVDALEPDPIRPNEPDRTPTICHHLQMNFNNPAQTDVLPDGFVKRVFVDTLTIQHLSLIHLFETVGRILVFGGTFSFPFSYGMYATEFEDIYGHHNVRISESNPEYRMFQMALGGGPEIRNYVMLTKTYEEYKRQATALGFVNFKRHFHSAQDPYPIQHTWMDDQPEGLPWYSMSKVG